MESIDQYLRYLSYKIIMYVQIFYGPIIERGVLEWMRDDMNDYYFTNAYRITYNEGQVFHMTNEMFYKSVEAKA